MRLFLDASLSPAVAAELRSLGVDAIAQRDVLPGNATDDAVMRAAHADGRFIVARDFDMAELALRRFAPAIAVVIVAFDFVSPQQEALRIQADLALLGDGVLGSVVVLEANRIRSPRPIS